MNINNIKTNVMKLTGRRMLIVKKHSPEILMITGVVGVIAGTVMACKATLKAEEVLDHAKEKFETIKQAKELANPQEYTQQDYQKDLTIAYVQTGVDFVKLYGPSVVVITASIACMLSSHNIMKKRNLALMAAYKAVEKSFNAYRSRVVEELGIDKDREFKTGIKREYETVIEVDESGKKVKVKKPIDVIDDPNKISEYARFFDESCRNWTKSPEHNLTFLKVQQNYANDLLQAQGHVFLNEIYDLIGVPRTQAGAVVGWVRGNGDDFVDFGIWTSDREKVRDFVNGYERSILLDFNVDGVIYDLI